MLHTEPLTSQAKAYPGLNYSEIEGTVLATIINRKVEDVKEIKVTGERTLPRVSFKDALSADGRNFILECKQSSPTLGDFCRDFDLDKLINCYEKHASAISVLCEKHFFKGSLEYLKFVKERTSLPVLCKDFIICREQLDEAYVAGADAVLLMLSVLSKETYEDLYEYAHKLGLDVLTEVDSRADALYCREHKIEIVGINNRDLRTLKIDLSNARELSTLFDKDVRVVSESGINKHSDLTSLKPISNFLIGSALTGDSDVEFKAKSMLYGLNKVCGLTTKEAVKSCAKNNVSIGGLIFAKKSPRYVTLDKAKEITADYKGDLKFAGVFVDEELEVMVKTAKEVGLSYIQLHGQESIDLIEKLHKALPDIKIIKAINVKSAEDFSKLDKYDGLCDLFILDSASPGSGSCFDWNSIPKSVNHEKILLSGGIGPDNVEIALKQGFLGLDLNSKLEKVKGIKDTELINEIFKTINEY
ncbi:bifunctional indole-3-glycerol-phosphate synthase TrpC/phosphoribosylanthranilate isomerase TrpF [Succinivibrio dextrinosolvens]|uniref:bifunctional indole-3-glycerol-phosphate synthase TrpC/phosphoribosylanthranilate isomerase TrpF n=1 Tax=Succinivibrio dextrinosolvens TaxID=83771 RepID=UPI00192167A8|nr:bifunctional indole-3-glycerol-phosphate synthase TrpC/phosphoribosylanthranilate isomerase TrpF [Succinivibrio dextrinosolvens]